MAGVLEIGHSMVVDKYVIAAACHKHAYEAGRLCYQYKRLHDSWWTRFWPKLLGIDAGQCFARGFALGHAEQSGCHGC